MGKLIRVFIFSVCLILPFQAESQEKLETDQVLDFFNAIYNYDFEAAYHHLREVERKHPGQPQTFLCESNYYWWLMMTGMEDDVTLAEFEKANQAVIGAYADLDPEWMSPNGIFSIIHGYAYETRYALHHKRHRKGIANLSKILPYLKIALSDPFDNPRYRFVAGLYHYLAAVTKEEHPILRPFFSLAPDSDKDLGYKLLSESATSDDPLIQTESTYFLMKINLEIASRPAEAIKWSKVLVENYPNNILYHFYLLNSYVERGLKFSSRQEYRTIEALSEQLPGLSPAQRSHFIQEGKELLENLR